MMDDNDLIEEETDDELDFDDFLEDISDKIDLIKDKLEEHTQESRQRWERTKKDIDEQKRLLKVQLEQRIHVLSEDLNKPSSIRTRDKIIFTIGVANTCFSPLIAGKWPEILPIIYTIQAFFLIPLRFFNYKRKNWHYFVYEFCYYVNLLILTYLWFLPSSTILFTVCYLFSHGPLALAIVLWRNSLVFHNFDKVTSIFIHVYPLLTMFTLRWLLPFDIQQKKYPAIVNLGSTMPIAESIFYIVIFYLIWQITYYILIVYGRGQKVAAGSRVTSYSWLLTSDKSFISHLVNKMGFGGSNDGMNRHKIIIYFVLQFGYTVISILPACILFYRYMYVSLIYVCLVFAISVYNGASYYIEVFSRRYIKSLELLKENDNSDANKTKTSEKSSSTTTETSKNSHNIENKKET